MSICIKCNIDITEDKIIDCLNFFDKNNIPIELSDEQLDDVYNAIIKDRKYDLLDFFIDRGEYPTQMLNYCYEDDVEVISYIIDKYNEDPFLFLVCSIDIGLAEVVLEILSEKYSVKAMAKYNGGIILNTIVTNGDKELLELFLSKGFKISYCTLDPINNALVNNRMNLIPYLLENGSSNNNITLGAIATCVKKSNKTSINYIAEMISNDATITFENKDINNITAEINTIVVNGYVELALQIISKTDTKKQTEIIDGLHRLHRGKLDLQKHFHIKLFFDLYRKYLSTN